MCFRSKSDQPQDDAPQEIPKVIITRASTDRAVFGEDVELRMEHVERYESHVRGYLSMLFLEPTLVFAVTISQLTMGPPQIFQLPVASVFSALDEKQELYAHYMVDIVFPGINLSNHNDIRQETSYKNIIFSNRMIAESQRSRGLHMVDEAERHIFKEHRPHAYYICALHEILGHGTGRFLAEPGQTWTGVLGDLSATVDKCRAELVGAFLIDEPEILGLFGYTQDGDIKPDDVIHNMYLQLGADGLRGLENYDPHTKIWGQAHSRAHYAILRHLLRNTKDLYTVLYDSHNGNLTVKVNGNNVLLQGKPSLGRMLLRLHIYRCTADIAGCREFYEDLSSVDGEAL
ncbi:dipeptidyl peptidase III, putative [Talaromyces stipitatus ATCC 10500]|uniref:Dipeptidyl peptidase III, putative n=1 Tax=Talaromyces stipitatus (strain ATCC 10500 / CBS 375.48 / QM 6759 / NRRL 1006) TaxID=441959 RepID=B8M6H5_TALSN|nr:dipeptidyl peptidase III, putative [Talaromyces stipitatus ATCC 10500]EED19437.1 dipeptidyl peptidase III, putative [Talaromyces stipitatus ATCC 10500]